VSQIGKIDFARYRLLIFADGLSEIAVLCYFAHARGG
jgi:hypothetical protein